MKKLGALLLSLTLVLALFPMTAGAAAAAMWYSDSAGDYVNIGDTDAFYSATDLSAYLLEFDGSTTTLFFESAALALDLDDLVGASDLSGITVVINDSASLTIKSTLGTVNTLALAGIYTLGDAVVEIDYTGADFDFVLNGVAFGPNGVFADAGSADAKFDYAVKGLAEALNGTGGAIVAATPVAEIKAAMALLPATIGDYSIELTAGSAILARAFTLPAGSDLTINTSSMGGNLAVKADTIINGTVNVLNGDLVISDRTFTINGTVNVEDTLDIQSTTLVGVAGTLNVKAGAAATASAPLTVAGAVNVAGTGNIGIAADSFITGTVKIASGGQLDIDAGVTLTVSAGGLLDFAATAGLGIGGAAFTAAGGVGSGSLYVASSATVQFTTLTNAQNMLSAYSSQLGILTLGKTAIVKPESVSDAAIEEIFGVNNRNFERLTTDPATPVDPTAPTGPKGSNLSTPLNKGGKYAITNVVRDGNGNLVVTVIGAANMVNGLSINGVTLTRDAEYNVGANGILSTITVSGAVIPSSGTLNINVKFVNDGSASASAVR